MQGLQVDLAGKKLPYDLLGNERGIAAGAVVDDDVDPGVVLDGSLHEIGRFIHHLGIHHAVFHLAERVGQGIGVFVTHTAGGHEADDALLSTVEEPPATQGKLP